jgi:uncharacterized protein YndB with AHSA1/START domain
MTKNDFTITIAFKESSQDIFRAITDGLGKWWGGQDLSGHFTRLGDEFVIHHPGAHYSKQKIVELIPDEKVTWLVTESEMSWLKKDKREWTNTKMVFEIVTEGDKTLLKFTHEGLVPEKECYERCTHEGWNIVINDYLYNLITEGKAHF